MLRTFDGTSWSEPTALYNFNLDKDHAIQQYDLLMRGDTVLVAATLLETGQKGVMRYASKHISSNNISYYDESLKAQSFHMKRVGQNAVVAMIYAASDSISDIYVKTVNMTGRGDGREGNDLGVGYNLPDNVPSNEFLNLEGDKISTSRNWAVWLNEYLDDFPGKQDVLRYVLTANAPETKDNDFTWADFQARNNNELVAIYGNFVNRALVLTNKYFEGRVPACGELTGYDKETIEEFKNVKATLEELLENFKFR
jgi:hypothetical protein